MPEVEYPIWCAEPNCGIDDCDDCPFSPWNLRQKQKELEKKFDSIEARYETKRDTIFKLGEVQSEMDNKQNQEISELKDKPCMKLTQRNINCIERNRLRVDELKVFRHHVAMPRIITNEEVLREFINRVDLDDSYRLLKKLDGKDAEKEPTEEYNPYDAKMILVEPYQVVVEKADLEWLINYFYDGSENYQSKKYKDLKEKYLREDADDR